MPPTPRVIPFAYEPPAEAEVCRRASAFYEQIRTRRTIREYSTRPVPRDVIESCLRAAATAPSGANLQPWHFVAVSDPAIKRDIRLAAEEEEREFYTHRAPQAWLEVLAPLGTDSNKPFLERAPWLIAIFVQMHGVSEAGQKIKHYYASESVGIATGLLIAAVHAAGLVSLTHTPSPMGFLNRILDRPANEKPFLLLVVGYPEPGVVVPDIARKPFESVASWR